MNYYLHPFFRRKKSIYLIVFLLSILFSSSFGQSTDGLIMDQAPLKKTLELAASYANRVKQIVLYFYCTETIEDTNYAYKYSLATDYAGIPNLTITAKKPVSKKHEYDYQMVRNDNELYEQRNPIGEKQLKPRASVTDSSQFYVSPSTTNIDNMRIKYTVYGAVGFLSSYWQRFFTYKLLGQDKMNGRQTWIVSAEPNSDRKENFVRGKIWIDALDGSVHQIDFIPLDMKDYPVFLPPPTTAFARQVNCLIRFNLLKHGVLFPSEERLSDSYQSPFGSIYLVHTAQIKFHDYNFFIVETQVDTKTE